MREEKILTEADVFDLQIGTEKASISREKKHFFDITGYLILDRVIKPGQALEARQVLTTLVKSPRAGIKVDTSMPHQTEILNVIEAGGVFEELMAHSQVLSYLGSLIWGHQFRLIRSRAILREPGFGDPLNQGGRADPRRYARYRCTWEGEFRCLMITCLVALSDAGKGQGPFCVLPGSHKSNLSHPYSGIDLDNIASLEEISLKAGSGVLFTETLSHAIKSPPAETQAWVEFQYGPSYMVSWPGCDASAEILARNAGRPERLHLLMEPYYHPAGSQQKRKKVTSSSQ